MASPPEQLTLKANRDDGHAVELAARRVLVGLLTLLAILALFNVFGQNPTHSTGAGEAATLEVSAPNRLRGGLFYEGQFTVRAERDLARTTLVLDSGWFESMHINSYTPEPADFDYEDGTLVLDYGPLEGGETLVARLELQVNPTNLGRRSQSAQLRDGDELLASVERTVTIFP